MQSPTRVLMIALLVRVRRMVYVLHGLNVEGPFRLCHQGDGPGPVPRSRALARRPSLQVVQFVRRCGPRGLPPDLPGSSHASVKCPCSGAS